MYDHYIALDWAKSNMALAKMTGKSSQVTVKESYSDIENLKIYLKSLKGEKIFTVEETTSAQWLYTELKPFVTKLIVCDPYRNRLLSEGPKNDRIDAIKLVRLLKANMLKEVYHSGEFFINLRKLVSGYHDVVRSLVRLKNQRSALFRSIGLDHKKDSFYSKDSFNEFVLSRIEEQISMQEKIKKEYGVMFKRLESQHKIIRLLKSIPGIGDIHAVQIAVCVVNISRFPNKGHFLSYCGLIKHEKKSGGISYGRRSSRYYRPLKQVFKMASHSATMPGCRSRVRQLYEHYINEKNMPVYMARHKIARRLAVLSYGVLKSGKRYESCRKEKQLKK